VPTYNLLIIGLLTFSGCMVLNYERAAELINFGAFLAFMGVNAAAIRIFYVRAAKRDRRLISGVLFPSAGFLFCFVIWLNLSKQATVAGAIWFAVGTFYDAVISKGIRTTPKLIEIDSPVQPIS
jgi:putrescine importer